MTALTPTFFDFEADFVASLRCIPMQVRYKLDTCGIKLKLEQWHQFAAVERERLVIHPCETPTEIAAYRTLLQALIAQYTPTPAQELPIEPHPPWAQADLVPPAVAAQAQQWGVAIAPAQWAALTPLERFALCKLSRPGHENRNFRSALSEFNLTEPQG
ncbi:MAG TPA: nitrate reductase associated protein [Candidatus Obscuribacterales bacterium]